VSLHDIEILIIPWAIVYAYIRQSTCVHNCTIAQHLNGAHVIRNVLCDVDKEIFACVLCDSIISCVYSVQIESKMLLILLVKHHSTRLLEFFLLLSLPWTKCLYALEF